MAARAGLTKNDVVAAAVAKLDEGCRAADLSLGALARSLGIRPQSLYAHVDGVDGLARALAVAGLDDLGVEVINASIGRSGRDAVTAIVRAHLDFARRRPSLYEAAIHPPGRDPELIAAVERVGAPLEQVLTGMGLASDDRVHWTRLFLSTVFGYAVLSDTGRFALPVETETTQTRLVDMLTGQLATPPA